MEPSSGISADNKTAIITDFNECWKESFSHWSLYHEQAKRDHEFHLGRQWSLSEAAARRNKDQNALTFNKIRKVVNVIAGFQRKNRLALKIDPVEGSSQLTADQFSALVMWIMQYSNGYTASSDAFEGCVKTGMNLIKIWLSYQEDPVFGDFCFEVIPYNRFYLAPNFTKHDLSDCAYALTRTLLNKAAIKGLLPKSFHEWIDDIRPSNAGDTKFPMDVMPSGMTGQGLYKWEEFYRWTSEDFYLVADRSTQKTLEVPKKAEPYIDQLVGADPQRLVKIPRTRRSMRFSLMVENEVVYDGPDPLKIGHYPFVPKIAYYDPEHEDPTLRIQGIVRCMIDPQVELNKRYSKTLDIIDTQVGSGIDVEIGALVNPEDAYETGQGVVRFLKDGKINAVRSIKPPDIPLGLLSVADKMDKQIMEIPGANDELFGAPQTDNIQIAAVLAKMRSAAALVTLQKLFDNDRDSVKLIGQKLVRAIQNNWGPEKIQRIIKKPLTPEFFNRDFGKYDCVPEEGILTDTQKQMAFAKALGLKAAGLQIIPDDFILGLSDLPGKDDLAKNLQGKQQAAEEAKAKQDQLQLALVMANIRNLEAKAMASLHSARHDESAMQRDEAMAVVNMIRAAKEIQGMDLESWMKVLMVLNKLEGATGKEGSTGLSMSGQGLISSGGGAQ